MKDLGRLPHSDISDNVLIPLDVTPTDNSIEIALQKETEAIAREAEETRINEIRESLDSKVIITEEPLVQLKIEAIVINGKKVNIAYVPKEKLAPAFGYCHGDGYIEVRDDLPPRVKKFVRSHELYHHSDTSQWGGWIGREIRANFFPGLRDPIGLLATIYATLSTKERIDLYLDRIKRKY